MSLVLVTPATTLPIDLADVRADLHIDHADDDAAIEAMIWAAIAHAERWSGRVFAPATWDLVLDGFPTAEIEIPLGPVASVASVTYVDVNGAEQTVSPGDYTVDLASMSAWVVPTAAWPVTMSAVNAVRVRFVAGVGLPHDVQRAVRLLVGHWYANREAVSEGDLKEVPLGFNSLMNLHRRMFV